MPSHALDDVQVYLFDVFGTVVDWHGSMVRHLQRIAPFEQDWSAFAREWRSGYLRVTRHVAEGGKGPATVDEMHGQILDEMLASIRWSKLGLAWDHAVRAELVQCWHKLDPWPDTVPGLTALRQKRIIGTLSNGNLKLLVDMAKHASLPWDILLSSSLFKSYKPHPSIYNGAASLLSLPPSSIALVAAHFDDCKGAKACGMKAVYVRRATEDIGRDLGAVSLNGEVDCVVDSFEELARKVSEGSKARL